MDNEQVANCRSTDYWRGLPSARSVPIALVTTNPKIKTEGVQSIDVLLEERSPVIRAQSERMFAELSSLLRDFDFLPLVMQVSHFGPWDHAATFVASIAGPDHIAQAYLDAATKNLIKSTPLVPSFALYGRPFWHSRLADSESHECPDKLGENIAVHYAAYRLEAEGQTESDEVMAGYVTSFHSRFAGTLMDQLPECIGLATDCIIVPMPRMGAASESQAEWDIRGGAFIAIGRFSCSPDGFDPRLSALRRDILYSVESRLRSLFSEQGSRLQVRSGLLHVVGNLSHDQKSELASTPEIIEDVISQLGSHLDDVTLRRLRGIEHAAKRRQRLLLFLEQMVEGLDDVGSSTRSFAFDSSSRLSRDQLQKELEELFYDVREFNALQAPDSPDAGSPRNLEVDAMPEYVAWPRALGEYILGELFTNAQKNSSGARPIRLRVEHRSTTLQLSVWNDLALQHSKSATCPICEQPQNPPRLFYLRNLSEMDRCLNCLDKTARRHFLELFEFRSGRKRDGRSGLGLLLLQNLLDAVCHGTIAHEIALDSWKPVRAGTWQENAGLAVTVTLPLS